MNYNGEISWQEFNKRNQLLEIALLESNLIAAATEHALNMKRYKGQMIRDIDSMISVMMKKTNDFLKPDNIDIS